MVKDFTLRILMLPEPAPVERVLPCNLIVMRIFFSLIFILNSNILSSQNSNEGEYLKPIVIIPSVGVLFQNSFCNEVKLGIGKAWAPKTDGKIFVGYYAGFLGFEFIPNGMHFLAPKVGAEANLAIISTRLSFARYSNMGISQFRLTPEIGLCFGSYINLMYGYGIPFTNNHLPDVSSSRISLSVNIPLRLVRNFVTEDKLN